jgi:pseudouridine-5'-phosphate glycosidase
MQIAAPVAEALKAGRAVVGLESAVITHGLPPEAAMEAVRRQSRACERAGAVAAVVGLFEGSLWIGLSTGQCSALASHTGAVKVSPWNLAAARLRPGFGGTTVAATIAVCAKAGLNVISTGGIGGVHPGANGQDVSADLTELSRRPVCVVCAGPKSTLDAAATLERLETLAVPVVGWRSSLLAGFLAISAGVRVPVRVDSTDELASLVRNHWELGGNGIIVSQPLSSDHAIDATELIGDSDRRVAGPQRTPAELRSLQARLGDRVIEANIALLEGNAALAASLATVLSRDRTQPRRQHV